MLLRQRPSRSATTTTRGLWILTLALTFTGCAPVPAYTRGLHAKQKMQLDPTPEATALEQHVFEYREGATGGFGSVGGGCGCN